MGLSVITKVVASEKMFFLLNEIVLALENKTKAKNTLTMQKKEAQRAVVVD